MGKGYEDAICPLREQKIKKFWGCVCNNGNYNAREQVWLAFEAVYLWYYNKLQGLMQLWKPNQSSSASRMALQINQASSKPMSYLWSGGDI